MRRTRLTAVARFVLLITAPAYLLRPEATTLPNSPPLAITDSYTIHGSLLLKPMQNDSDPDGNWITFVGITTQPQHGRLAYVRPGEYTYTPTAGYSGSDSFTYRIRDSLYAYSTGTAYLLILPGPPYDASNQLTQKTTTRSPGFTDMFSYDPAGSPIKFNGVTKTYNSNK